MELFHVLEFQTYNNDPMQGICFGAQVQIQIMYIRFLKKKKEKGPVNKYKAAGPTPPIS